MGRKLKLLAALGGLAAAHKCEEDGNDGSAALFYAIGLGAAISLERELLEEEAVERAAIERQEEAGAREAERHWREKHICCGCGNEFDELYDGGLCYDCWYQHDMSLDDD